MANYISYDNINTGRRKKAAQNQPQSTPMTTQELEQFSEIAIKRTKW